jgi:hypothetical protein
MNINYPLIQVLNESIRVVDATILPRRLSAIGVTGAAIGAITFMVDEFIRKQIRPNMDYDSPYWPDERARICNCYESGKYPA